MASSSSSIGVFGVDPGGTTGVAWGLFVPGVGAAGARGGWQKALAGLAHSGAAEVKGDEIEQALMLQELWWGFLKAAKPKRRVICMEDFYLRVGPGRSGARSGARAGLAPVRVACAWEGLRLGLHIGSGAAGGITPVTYQQPGEAKGFVTDARLRKAERWERGSAHKRDAWRHVGLGLARMLEKGF